MFTRIKQLSLLPLLWCAPIVHADAIDEIEKTASALFAGMPRIQTVSEIIDRCGADEHVNDAVAYCTSQNVIFVTGATRDLPEAAYLVAHAYGHAVQVRHGVADFALAEIRKRRDEEVMLRGLVARQVDCIAGFLVARSDLPQLALADMMSEEPFAGIHWGRDPLRLGPTVSIGLGPRDRWYQIGLAGDLSLCEPGEFSSALLMDALRS